MARRKRKTQLQVIMEWCNENDINYATFQYYETLRYIRVIKYLDMRNRWKYKIECNDFVRDKVLNGGMRICV